MENDKIEDEKEKLEKTLADFATQDDPFQVEYAKVLEKAFSMVLKWFGIPSDISDDETQIMLLEKEIQIAEVTEPLEVAGFYISQGHNNPVFKVYISYPFMKNGELTVSVERHI